MPSKDFRRFLSQLLHSPHISPVCTLIVSDNICRTPHTCTWLYNQILDFNLLEKIKIKHDLQRAWKLDSPHKSLSFTFHVICYGCSSACLKICCLALKSFDKKEIRSSPQQLTQLRKGKIIWKGQFLLSDWCNHSPSRGTKMKQIAPVLQKQHLQLLSFTSASCVRRGNADCPFLLLVVKKLIMISTDYRDSVL